LPDYRVSQIIEQWRDLEHMALRALLEASPGLSELPGPVVVVWRLVDCDGISSLI
jgi:hypothetical protein